MGKYSMIIAEDEQLILNDIADEVSQTDLGFAVVGTTFNGKDALKLVRELRPDVLLTDVRMPIMDGLQLASLARAENPDLFIVIISGYDDFSYAQKAIKCGVSDYLQKPLSTEALRETLSEIKSAIDKRRASAPPAPLQFSDMGKKIINQKLTEIERYIREHYMDEIDFELLFSELNYNATYLGRAFKKRFGKTPQQYQRQLRIEEAMRIIVAYPYVDVYLVGQQVGYCDGHYFSRVFKAVTGKSPSEFRGAIKSGSF